MNKKNVKVTHISTPDGRDHIWDAEWADRALDDDDRYEADDTEFLIARGSTEKEMWSNLAMVYDEWIRETR